MCQTLFTPDGEPTEALRHVRDVLAGLQRAQESTRDQLALLDGHGLLVKRGLEVRLAGGGVLRIEGFRVVDDARLAALAPQALCELRDLV